jgi:hypothetical protein
VRDVVARTGVHEIHTRQARGILRALTGSPAPPSVRC